MKTLLFYRHPHRRPQAAQTCPQIDFKGYQPRIVNGNNGCQKQKPIRPEDAVAITSINGAYTFSGATLLTQLGLVGLTTLTVTEGSEQAIPIPYFAPKASLECDPYDPNIYFKLLCPVGAVNCTDQIYALSFNSDGALVVDTTFMGAFSGSDQSFIADGQTPPISTCTKPDTSALGWLKEQILD